MKKIFLEGVRYNYCISHIREAVTMLQDSWNMQVDLEESYAIVEI